ncbi:MAG: hypothetical protein IKV55_03975, partial [Oscillospiraceae bacterium]|nr:hypothetical protein [Oscillospiraceae bacterium]
AFLRPQKRCFCPLERALFAAAAAHFSAPKSPFHPAEARLIYSPKCAFCGAKYRLKGRVLPCGSTVKSRSKYAKNSNNDTMCKKRHMAQN